MRNIYTVDHVAVRTHWLPQVARAIVGGNFKVYKENIIFCKRLFVSITLSLPSLGVVWWGCRS